MSLPKRKPAADTRWNRLRGKAPARSGRELAGSLLWNFLLLLAASVCLGLWSLYFACVGMPRSQALLSYFDHPAIVVLNILPIFLLALLATALLGKLSRGFAVSGGLTVLGSVVNAVKITLRDDPLYVEDLGLISEGGKMAGNYNFGLSGLEIFLIAAAIAGVVAACMLMQLTMPRWRGQWKGRLVCLAVTAAAAVASFLNLYWPNTVYQSAAVQNYSLFNQWSAAEDYQSRGFLFPFLHTAQNLVPTPPEGYDARLAAQMLSNYEDESMDPARQVNIISIMLEAYCDFSEYLPQEEVAAAYAGFHQLQQEGVSGTLVTNIFAGGTVDTERAFLTGMTTFGNLRSNTNSYVYYFKEQGYTVEGGHPGYDWFYNRLNVMEYLGFDNYYFTENYYGDLVDPTQAIYRSDEILFDSLYRLFCENKDSGSPYFSFSVTYQNHGPYDSASATQSIVTPEGTGWSAETCNILSNYLSGVADTSDRLLALTRTLEADEAPIVLVFFGDHKPWLGDGNSVYKECGIDIDNSTTQGFVNYYSTPYVIWANTAAKEALGSDVAGDGPTISPNFLMTELFDVLGYEGPAYMQANREAMAALPVITNGSVCLVNGEITGTFQNEAATLYNQFRNLEYYWQRNFLYD